MDGADRQIGTGADSDLFHAALEALGHALFITDRQGIILYVNPAFTDTTGFVPDELIGKTPAVFHAGQRSTPDYRQVWQIAEQDGEWEGTLWNRRRDGGLHHERLHIRRMSTANGEVRYVGVFSDSSEQDTLQRALANTQKRELMAALTGGMAHNLNNYMAAIRGFAQLGQRMTAEPKSARYFSEVLEASDKAGTLIADILKTAHPDPSDHVVDLWATVHRAMHTAQSILPDRIELIADVPKDGPCLVIGNRSDIEQTVLNLVTNARDALEGREDAHIRVRLHASAGPNPCPERCPYAGDCPVRPGRHVTLQVEDNGTGIPEEIQGSIFDPFFTTKGASGTGLGLASANQIIHRLGGAIWIDPAQQAGTRFQICLPLLDDDARAYDI